MTTISDTIIPIRMGIKHDPPTLALIYKRQQQDVKERIYSILLNRLVELSDPKLIALKLFDEHSLILNENIVDIDQVEKLVGVLMKRYEEKRVQEICISNSNKDQLPIQQQCDQNNQSEIMIQLAMNDNQKQEIAKQNIENNYNNGDSSKFENYSNLNTMQTINQQDLNSPKHDNLNSSQLSEENDFNMSGYNPSFSARNDSLSEQKFKFIQNKNLKNQQKTINNQKNQEEVNQNERETFDINNNNSQNDNNNQINSEINTFIDYNQNINKNKNILQPQINQSNWYQQNNFSFETPVKDFIYQVDDKYNFNTFQNNQDASNPDQILNNLSINYDQQSNSQYLNNNQNDENDNLIELNSQPPFTGFDNVQVQEKLQKQGQQTSRQHKLSRRRNKLGWLKDLANQHRENDENLREDQLEQI